MVHMRWMDEFCRDQDGLGQPWMAELTD
jgi:hypothetical protein